MKLKENERIDDLLDERMQIIQSPAVSTFSLDAVLLSQFVYVPIQKGDLLDLCTGNGVIPLLLSERTKGKITGVEIQEKIHDMAIRNVQLNQLDHQIEMIQADLKDLPDMYGNKKFDVVTCNPPYFQTPGTEQFNKNPHLAIARHEIYCTLEDVVRVSSRMTKQGGKVAFVHRPGRLLDIIMYMRQYRIEPKRIRFVYPKAGREANTLLIEGIKDGKPDLKILPPLIVYTENDENTEELNQIIYGK